jgi:ATP:cob(I)alamin adenosyltransferase
MKQIYTKTGDGGQTSIRGKVRVDKDDIRIETNGQIDHLNALLGYARSMLPEDNRHKQLLFAVQRELMVVMSHVATPEGDVNPRQLHAEALTLEMEQAIDAAQRPPGFIIPGSNSLSAAVHIARTQARTAERRLWELNRQIPVDKAIMAMMNRLSDYLFIVATELEQ